MTGINLLPWRNSLRLKKERHFRQQWIIIFMIMVIVLVALHLVLWRQLNITTKQTVKLQQQLSWLEKQLQDKNNTSKEQQQQQPQPIIDKIISLEQQCIGLIQIFEKLHQNVTANSQLTQLMIKSNNVKLFGTTNSMFGIAQLVKGFSQTKYYATPLVQKISRQGDGYDFILSFTI